MKMRCEIIAAENRGDNFKIKVQARQSRAAEWRSWNCFEIEMPAHPKTIKAFHVGRIVKIEIKT